MQHVGRRAPAHEIVTCPRCNGYVGRGWHDELFCLNCGWNGAVVEAPEATGQGRPTGYAASVKLSADRPVYRRKLYRRRQARIDG